MTDDPTSAPPFCENNKEMTQEERLLKILRAITHISNNDTLDFKAKLQEILLKIAEYMQSKRGSIMLVKGRKTLEVMASTNPALVGTKQSLDGMSPSAWVVKNKSPLYVDKNTGDPTLKGKAGQYERSAFLIVPIARGDKVIGVLSVTDKVGVDAFDKAEQETLLEIIGQVISALEMERLANSLEKSRKVLENKNRQLKKLERLRTDLFNMLIHDLKGPISEVVANLDILSYTVGQENSPFVESAQTGCDTLESMVSNLLDIARFEERKLKLLYERIDPVDLVKEALGRLFRVGKTKQIEFAETIPPSPTKRFFSGDRGVLLRVLQNLLTNAIRYSPAGDTVEVGFEYLKTPKIRFFVKDHGPGVPAEHRQAIFDKFLQLEKKHDGRIYTTGLGLTFCRMAVQAHRGRIGVADESPRGSRFWFALPLER
jgi:K+-sensing histidine kinase KdpD